ncbi:uncharacterized protein LTHEOB_12475 [Lasiodiplodia theobromae]|uniref:uncharacterized protein n=1 Tax=Lasiodiplodia theobromae TaxID=45133 RepID=UPI0015C3A3CA|nr:uncharacterized protein LTHEOB_12475 [Lasiodiplodia theobromae]KAF4535872.1 hypothetical protein LTHEOB_12475 [Lasiodiplodia theobromae]
MKFSTAAALLFATLAVASPMPCVPDDPTSCVGIGKREPEPAPEPCVPDDPTSCVGVGKREPEPEPRGINEAAEMDVNYTDYDI